MTPEQKSVLEARFASGADWSVDAINGLAMKMNLPAQKIYKWSWDRRKKAIADEAQL